jgi:hypothetical protein
MKNSHSTRFNVNKLKNLIIVLQGIAIILVILFYHSCEIPPSGLHCGNVIDKKMQYKRNLIRVIYNPAIKAKMPYKITDNRDYIIYMESEGYLYKRYVDKTLFDLVEVGDNICLYRFPMYEYHKITDASGYDISKYGHDPYAENYTLLSDSQTQRYSRRDKDYLKAREKIISDEVPPDGYDFYGFCEE